MHAVCININPSSTPLETIQKRCKMEHKGSMSIYIIQLPVGHQHCLLLHVPGDVRFTPLGELNQCGPTQITVFWVSIIITEHARKVTPSRTTDRLSTTKHPFWPSGCLQTVGVRGAEMPPSRRRTIQSGRSSSGRRKHCDVGQRRLVSVPETDLSP